MFLVMCDVTSYKTPFFEIQDGGFVFCTLSKFEAFLSQFKFENVRNRTKTVLVTLNTRTLSKILML